MACVDMCSGRGIHGYSQHSNKTWHVWMCSGRGIHGYSQHSNKTWHVWICVVDEVYMGTVNIATRHGMGGYV